MNVNKDGIQEGNKKRPLAVLLWPRAGEAGVGGETDNHAVTNSQNLPHTSPLFSAFRHG